VELELRDRVPVHFVWTIGEANRARVGPGRRQAEVVADPGAAMRLDGAIEDAERHPRGDHLDHRDRRDRSHSSRTSKAAYPTNTINGSRLRARRTPRWRSRPPSNHRSRSLRQAANAEPPVRRRADHSGSPFRRPRTNKGQTPLALTMVHIGIGGAPLSRTATGTSRRRRSASWERSHTRQRRGDRTRCIIC
jgi:hypothetical protein